ncbi:MULTISPECIES: hypothetical protein [Xanthomonas]|uniref:Uncharacterized protein n=1 Tax=Xanthomonas hortorum pv. hederae TaxID=453603 RepID=A0A9X4H9Z0_9XANT|nr:MULTISPECIES: hypothetical protein [Xanthomonas]MBB4133268.1 hypothetical protein [Xanthomonas sp. 3075]MCC5054049.1 hypothetical protein [Xanthomonas campestris pv. aberrans]MCC5088744.1 hypothetical protein [Xanthomonas campestris]MDC8640453.1 hypothetical protein [Xanthomonas hortorum pv. hederae]MEB1128547.1 hypothetical protein [Xanthomonas campestris pv. campestris]
MRELTNEELFLVAGAAAAADVDPSEPPTELPPVVVNPPPSPPPTIPPSPPVEQPGPISPPGGGGTPLPTAPEYDLNFTRALTAEESAALVKFDDAIYFVKDSISSLPDNAYMQMSDGSTVQMSEIKSLMLNADYKVNEAGTSYSNGFATGQSDYNNGDPQISINIDTIKGYSDLMGGANFLVMHELAHNAAAARTLYQNLYQDGFTNAEFNQNEKFANDIVRGVANYLSIGVLGPSDTKVVGGYSEVTPTIIVPTP